MPDASAFAATAVMPAPTLKYNIDDVTIGRALFSRPGRPYSGVEREPLVGQAASSSSSKRWMYILFAVGCLVLSGLVVVLIVTQVGKHHPHTHAPTPEPTTAATTVGTTTAPATATPASRPTSAPASVTAAPVQLTFLCNVPFGNTTCRAVYSYENPNAVAVTVPVGANNYIEPGPPGRGQRTVFKSGFHFGGATFLWNCQAHAQARWALRSLGVGNEPSIASAPQTAVTCPRVPSSAGDLALAVLDNEKKKKREQDDAMAAKMMLASRHAFMSGM